MEIKTLVNEIDNKFCIPLFSLSVIGYAKAVDLLLRKRADIEKSNMEDFTLLYSVMASGYLRVVKTLLAIGINI